MSKKNLVVRTIRVPVRIELIYKVAAETEQEALEEVDPPAIFKAIGGGIHASSLDPSVISYQLDINEDLGTDIYLWEESLIEEADAGRG